MTLLHLALLLFALALLGCAASNEAPPAAERVVVDFTDPAEAARWRPVDDVVMGGVSSSRIVATPEGSTAFEGEVSLENGGGFASVRTDGERCALPGARAVRLRVRGDGKAYRLRLRESTEFDVPSLQATFETVRGEWIDVELPLADFERKWRGRPVAGEPIDPAAVRSLGLVIADGQAGPFRLELATLAAR